VIPFFDLKTVEVICMSFMLIVFPEKRKQVFPLIALSTMFHDQVYMTEFYLDLGDGS
jgi:hypothetical protein